MFRLFPSPDEKQIGLECVDSPQSSPPPLPSCVEVLPSEASDSARYNLEPLHVDGLTLLKGRVSTQDVFSLSNSDLVPGKYEGGLKLWEGSLDLVKALRSEVQNGHLSFVGKRVLELGCGHGLPGIFACVEGAKVMHFQDFNAEVLQYLTIHNVNKNFLRTPPLAENGSDGETDCGPEVRFFAGDWSEIHRLLPLVQDDVKGPDDASGKHQMAGYDIILMAETVYSVSTLQTLYELIKKCMSHPHGVAFMAAKKYYFGVGGGTRRFLSVVEKDGVVASQLVAEVSDGSSNVREVWKLSFK